MNHWPCGLLPVARRLRTNAGTPSARLSPSMVDVRSEIGEALAGNPVDPGNIIESRTRRKKKVDYVKLNQTVFG